MVRPAERLRKVPKSTLQTAARAAAALAALTGVYGFLTLMGAFGPVSCWTAQSSSYGGPVTITRGCEAGIDYLFGSTAGNVPVLFFWSVVLLVFVATGSAAAWTRHRQVTWGTAVVGAGISVLGLWSIGWYFIIPGLLLVTAASALTIEAQDGGGGSRGPTRDG